RASGLSMGPGAHGSPRPGPDLFPEDCLSVPVLPTCLALILCDKVVHHRDTGHSDVLGAFWEIRLPSFPGHSGPFTVWVVLVNGAGRAPMRLKLELLPPDRLEEEPIVDIRFTMEFTDRRVVRIYLGRVEGLHLVSPGHYRVTLTAHDVTLVQADFIASETQFPS
ncbi:MAG TPA: hypothetical protein VFD43_06395, partial [Planctomycetota bacterium]|nr:hypothetical protein [Planctomycetota bacterium]